MKGATLQAFLGHELRIARRSLRVRAFAVGFLLLGSVPAVAIHLRRPHLDYVIGSATYASATLGVLPLCSALLAFLLAMDGIGRERATGAWTTATLSGLSNAGYLLRRYVSLLAIVLPLTALPLVVAAGIALFDGGGAGWAERWTLFSPVRFVGPWALHVAPLAASSAALALGVGTIGGSAAEVFLLLLVTFGAVPAAGNEILNRFGMRFAAPLGLLDVVSARWTTLLMVKSFQEGDDRWNWLFPLPESEAGFDASTAFEQSLAQGLLLWAAAATSLGVATLYLRRTRPDVPPRAVKMDHPLRNFLVSFGRLRERYTPDPAPGPADLTLLGLALALAAGAVALETERWLGYDALGARRYRTETSAWPAPTAVTLAPESWRIEGAFGRQGWMEVSVRGVLRNDGRKPERRLALSLNPEVAVRAASADRGTVRLRRSWDRLEAEVDPPIPPGGSRELRFEIQGRPGAPKFNLPPWQGGDLASFAHAFDRNRKVRLGHDRYDLSWSYEVPAVSGVRIDLPAEALTPVPRYSSFAPDADGNPPPEVFFPATRLSVSLGVPRGLLVADSCGGLADPEGRSSEQGGRDGRLESACTLPLAELTVRGGRQRLLSDAAGSRPAGSGIAVAVFPAHRAPGELHLGSLAGSAQRMEEAWPGGGSREATGRGGLILLEWPDEGVHERNHQSLLTNRWRDPYDSWIGVAGNLAFVREVDLIGTEPLPPERLAAEIVTSRLLRRRRFAPEESLFFRQLLRTLVLERLGLGSPSGAVVGPLPLGRMDAVHDAALDPKNYSYWQDRFPALVSALGRRAGAEALRASIEELLAPGPAHAETPARFAELAAILERRSERDVRPMIRDFFVAGRLPELVLEEVVLQPAGGGWRVTGQVHNLGDGESICRLVLTTDLGPAETEVRTETGTRASFAFTSSHRPQGVFLDPDQECHRLVRKGVPRDRVYFNGVR